MPTLLERTMPVYHFNEIHHRWIAASPDEVWAALTTISLTQLTVTRPLVALRHLGSRPAPARPLFTDGPIRILDVDTPRYALGATISQPWKFDPPRQDIESLDDFVGFTEPGWTKYLTDFRLEAEGTGVILTTETRGYSTDSHARRCFAVYWAAIRVGSGIVRRDILRTVARQSESAQLAA